MAILPLFLFSDDLKALKISFSEECTAPFLFGNVIFGFALICFSLFSLYSLILNFLPQSQENNSSKYKEIFLLFFVILGLSYFFRGKSSLDDNLPLDLYLQESAQNFALVKKVNKLVFWKMGQRVYSSTVKMSGDRPADLEGEGDFSCHLLMVYDKKQGKIFSTFKKGTKMARYPSGELMLGYSKTAKLIKK